MGGVVGDGASVFTLSGAWILIVLIVSVVFLVVGDTSVHRALRNSPRAAAGCKGSTPVFKTIPVLIITLCL